MTKIEPTSKKLYLYFNVNCGEENELQKRDDFPEKNLLVKFKDAFDSKQKFLYKLLNLQN